MPTRNPTSRRRSHHPVCYFRRCVLAGRIGGGRNTLRGLVGVGRRGMRLPVWGPLVFPTLVRERRQGRLRVTRLRLRHLRLVGGLTAVSGRIVGGEIRVLIAHGCYLLDGCVTTSLGCFLWNGCASRRIQVRGERPGADLLVSLHSTARGLDEGAHLTHATWASWAPTRLSSLVRRLALAWTCACVWSWTASTSTCSQSPLFPRLMPPSTTVRAPSRGSSSRREATHFMPR